MKVKFKIPVSINNLDYKPGTHEVPDDLSAHWYLLALVANGKASIEEKAKKPGVVVPGPKDKAEPIVPMSLPMEPEEKAPEMEEKSEKKSKEKKSKKDK